MKQILFFLLILPVLFVGLTGAAPKNISTVSAAPQSLSPSPRTSSVKEKIHAFLKEKDGNWLATVSLILGIIALLTGVLGAVGFLLFLYLSSAVVLEIVCIPIIGICISTLSSAYVTSVFFSLLSTIVFGGISALGSLFSLIFGITALGTQGEFSKKRQTASGLGIAFSIAALLLLLFAFTFGWLLVI
ncbi:MAG: hypothetical protein K1X92_09695 [Bacteroidia bacterium]|nr:hypothetical protein [Bacteroidia bacterium]